MNTWPPVPVAGNQDGVLQVRDDLDGVVDFFDGLRGACSHLEPGVRDGDGEGEDAEGDQRISGSGHIAHARGEGNDAHSGQHRSGRVGAVHRP